MIDELNDLQTRIAELRASLRESEMRSVARIAALTVALEQAKTDNLRLQEQIALIRARRNTWRWRAETAEQPAAQLRKLEAVIEAARRVIPNLRGSRSLPEGIQDLVDECTTLRRSAEENAEYAARAKELLADERKRRTKVLAAVAEAQERLDGLREGGELGPSDDIDQIERELAGARRALEGTS